MHKIAVALLVLILLLPACNIPTDPLTVILATPANGATTQSLTPVMTWVGLGDSYQLQVATEIGFQSLAVNEVNIPQLLYTVPSGRLGSATTYFWRVRASKGGQTGPWSTSWYFITPGAPTPPPSSTGTINIATSIDGSPWFGSINYTLSGPVTLSGSATPQAFANLPGGTYTLTYLSGGPSGAGFESITPGTTQTLTSGGSLLFNINLRSQTTSGAIQVNALHNGQPWSGSINYTISGPMTGSGYQVPRTSTGIIPGTYTLTYHSGGPSGAMLSGIVPSAQQTVTSGGTVYYTLNFTTQQPSYGNIIINATLDGAPWQVMPGSGGVSYNLIGPSSHTGSTVPANYSSQPTGSYTLSFSSGGPPGAVLTSITPAATQTLTAGGSITYTLNFHGQARGTVHVTATLNDEPWSGAVGYVVQGPYVTSGSHAPQSFSNAAAGTYSVSYSSGGPPGGTFEGVTPSSQILPAGGNIYFNIRFRYHGLLPQ